MLQEAYVQNSTGLSEKGVRNVIKLISEGATVPFISRYRKEMTGGLDEVEIATIRDSIKKYDGIITRQKTIIKVIEEQDQLTDELGQRIYSCFNLIELEDIYLPFKQKRLTKGEKARKMGLEPLAKMIMSQNGEKSIFNGSAVYKGRCFR